MMTTSSSSQQRYVYSKEFLLRRKEASISRSWPKHLNKQHINGVGLWDPVSYSRQLAKEEKLKRTKRQTGVINPAYQRKRTRDVRDSYSQNPWLVNGYNGYPLRNVPSPYYVQDEYDVYYDSYDNFGHMYDYVHIDDEYTYANPPTAGRKRNARPRRHGRSARPNLSVNGNLPAVNESSEPEWYTCGPTSHIETINLEGLPGKMESSRKQVSSSSSGESPVGMDVVNGGPMINVDKENDHKQMSRSNAMENHQNDQTRRDTVGKQLLQLIQNGPQNNTTEFPPNLPPEVKDATTSAELETALKGLLFKDKEKSTRQKSDELFARLKAKCMLNGQVKTVAELEGHAENGSTEKTTSQKDAKKSQNISESSARGNSLSNADSGDQSAFYRLLGMIKANGNLEEMPNAKLRISSTTANFPTKSVSSTTEDVRTIEPCKTAPITDSSLTVTSSSQGRSGNGDGDNTNNNSIKDASNAAAGATSATSAAAALAAVSTANGVTNSGRPSSTGRLHMPIPQTGLLRGASSAVAAAAAVAAAGMNPMLSQSHSHVQSHLLSSHVPPHILSAAAHQLFSQHSQQQPQQPLSTQQQQQQQQAQLAALAARYASSGVSPTPYIPPQWLYLAVAQQHAQAQQQQHQQQSFQQPPQPQQPHAQHGATLPNLVGNAASAAAVLQANSTQQVYRWFRAWSNATAAKVCIKQSSAVQSSSVPGKTKSPNEIETAPEVNANGINDVKKTLSESDIRNSTPCEEKTTQHSTHSTPGRGSLRQDDTCDFKKREKGMSDTEVEVSVAPKEKLAVNSKPTAKATMQSKSTQADNSPLRPVSGNSSGFTLVPPQRIAPPIQSTMSDVNNLFRLPQGYTPSLPLSMRFHQNGAGSSENGMEAGGGLGKWFGTEVIGSHRLVGLPSLSKPQPQDASGRTSKVEEVEKR